jgi:hypothetical protein
MSLPACGLYRTTVAIAGVEAERLVYFHNHGDPGPGLYLPVGWGLNRARFSERGQTLEDIDHAHTLRPLPAEGLYRVQSEFACCQRRCRTFAPETLLQLGYNGAGKAIVFDPEWNAQGLGFAQSGQMIDDGCLSSLSALVLRPPPPTDVAPAHMH